MFLCDNNIFILTEHVSYERSINWTNVPMRWTKADMEKWNL